MIQPTTILEIGTSRGGTTWHFYDNTPTDIVIYTLDLPDDEVPGDLTGTPYDFLHDVGPSTPRGSTGLTRGGKSRGIPSFAKSGRRVGHPNLACCHGLP
jgi:hypothetical protein